MITQAAHYILLIFFIISGLLKPSLGAEEGTVIEAAKGAQEWYQERRELYFGVPVQVHFKGKDVALAKKVWAYLESIDEHFNDYRDDSEVGRINKGSVMTHRLSTEMQQALQISYQAHAVSSGAFNITVGPLRRLWKAAAKTGQLPEENEIATAMSCVGMQHMWMDQDILHMHKPGVSLDFGGIIKGIAVDNAMRILREAGKEDAMVQVGGETAAIGLSPRGKAHAFAIPNPKHPNQLLQVVQDIGTGYSGCTSANYRLPIIIGGQPYYHIFDPRTGRPCSVHVLSVSVIFPQLGRNALADALSTSGVVLGPERFIALVESLGGDCLVLTQDEDGKIKSHESSAWQRYVRKSQ